MPQRELRPKNGSAAAMIGKKIPGVFSPTGACESKTPHRTSRRGATLTRLQRKPDRQQS
jgi:hypothetical protein